MQNWRLDNLLFAQSDNIKLIKEPELNTTMDTITDTEPFAVNYYNDAYDLEFLSIMELAQKTMKTTEHSINRFIVQPQINQYGYIQILNDIVARNDEGLSLILEDNDKIFYLWPLRMKDQ
ncbi:12171_t:CDS:2 [Funneliformis geosporum]|uniref:12171_t:CDS:1 n=1 Tax=Funneliformis geosporum TaxID=1117311 RepID=A0A9W4WRK2_9GLOM|nr:12171_t:CDS:2 [Funneliformis geosporum]